MGGKVPSSFELDLNADIDGNMDLDVSIPTDYSVSIKKFPPIDITVRPLDVSLRMKEIPSIRAHFPLDYRVGFSLLGRELVCIHLCGQGQAITEPYVPYPCEPQPQKGAAHLPMVAVSGDAAAKS